MFLLFLICSVDLILNVYQILVYLKSRDANKLRMSKIDESIRNLKRGK